MSLKELPEAQALLSWLGHFPRHPKQIHGIHEADSEILKLSKNFYLAMTVDSLSEEIAFRLYQDPYTMGWVTAMASLSDLAAVGARPEGLLFSAQLGEELDLPARTRLTKGLRDALRAKNTPLLGGDTGGAVSSVLSGIAIGTLDSTPTTRVGIRPGDLICITGKTGLGPALGFRHLLGGELSEDLFRPQARIQEGLKLRGLASASMDTSDGVAATLHTLLALNDVGMEIQPTLSHLDRRAVEYCEKMKLPNSALWFGEHGDFELVFAVPEKKLTALRRSLRNFSVIGKATSKKSGVHWRNPDGSSKPVDLGFLAHLPKSNLHEIKASFTSLIQYLNKSSFNFE